MGKTDIIAAIAAGLTGAVTIFLYLTISLPLLFHIAPLLLYTWDASNALGYQAASQASVATIILVGQGSHIIVSLVWGFVFVALLHVAPAIRRMPLAGGFIYGAFVMLFMHYVIVPLGHAPNNPYTLLGFTNTLIAHTFFFGMPLAWVAARFTKEPVRSYP
ncbi:MAG: hypothetical protein WBD74_13765 [Candidatus Aquilonibacter sp.]